MRATRKLQLENMAAELLDEEGIKILPVRVDRIIRSKGIEIRYEPADDDNLSGFILKDKKGRVVIGVNSNHHENRMRFTLAHELAHHILHDYTEIHVDRQDAGVRVLYRDQTSSDGTNKEEIEANYFAAAILMPKKQLKKESALQVGFSLADEEVLRKLARKYQVSPQSLTFRLINLGLIE